jgi:hypothetical protein
MSIYNDKRLTDTEWAIWEQTYDDGYHCEDCKFKYVINEPHGDKTRLCSCEDAIQKCPAVSTFHFGV